METNDQRVFDVRVTGRLTFATVKGNPVAKLADRFGTCIGSRRYMFKPEHFDQFIEEVRAVK